MARGKESSGGSHFRSAVTGQFVTGQQAQSSPRTTVQETRGGGSTGRHRSADTGQFVTQSYAESHPRTTVKES